MQVSLERMYAEATKALGETVVRERVLISEVQRLAAENAELLARSAVQADPDSGR